MSAKTEADKAKPNYPWTARQRRQKQGRRTPRKQVRVATRNKRT